MIKQSHPQIRKAISMVGSKKLVKDFPAAFKMIAWELMKTQTQLKDLKELMDKKMHQVTKRMETAARDVKKGKTKEAVKVLKKAEKKNEKLVKIDKNVRDPIIEKYEKITKKSKSKKG